MRLSCNSIACLGCLFVVSFSDAQIQSNSTPAIEKFSRFSIVSNEKACPASNDSQSSENSIFCAKAHKHGEVPLRPAYVRTEYVPLSPRGKFNIFFRSTYHVSTLVSAALEGTLAQAEGQWPGYCGGFPGWGKRIGASLADTEARKFVQSFALCTVLHQDPRYFHSRSRNHFVRAAYAVSRVVVTRSDKGNDVFNSSELLGTLFTSSLQNSYYPGRQRGFGRTVERFWSSFSSDATSNLLKEFWPDIHKLFRKHAPDALKEIEDRIPGSIEKEMAP